MAEYVECPSCGQEVPEGNFCDQCGQPLPQYVRCGSCGCKIPEGEFCGHCGEPLEPDKPGDVDLGGGD